MDVAELVLDYVRALIWPAVVLVVIVLFRQQVASALSDLTSAEVDAFGVKASVALLAEERGALKAKERQLTDAPSDSRIVHLEGFVSNQFGRPDVVIGNVEHRAVMAWRAFTRVVEEIVEVLGLPGDGQRTYESARASLIDAGIWSDEATSAERLLSATMTRTLRTPELAVEFFETTRQLADLLVSKAEVVIEADHLAYELGQRDTPSGGPLS